MPTVIKQTVASGKFRPGMANRIANLAMAHTRATDATYQFLNHVMVTEFQAKYGVVNEGMASADSSFDFALLTTKSTIMKVYTRMCIRGPDVDIGANLPAMPVLSVEHFCDFFATSGFGGVVVHCPSVLAGTAASQIGTAINNHIRKYFSRLLYEFVKYNLDVYGRMLKMRRIPATTPDGAEPSGAEEAADPTAADEGVAQAADPTAADKAVAQAADAMASQATAAVVARVINEAEGEVPADISTTVYAAEAVETRIMTKIVLPARSLYAVVRRGIRDINDSTLASDSDIQCLGQHEKDVFAKIRPILCTYDSAHAFAKGSIYIDMLTRPEAHLEAFLLVRRLVQQIPGKKVPAVSPRARSGTIHVSVDNDIIFRCILTGAERHVVNDAEAAADDLERTTAAAKRVATMASMVGGDGIPLEVVATAVQAATAAAAAAAIVNQEAPRAVVDISALTAAQHGLAEAMWVAADARRKANITQRQLAEAGAQVLSANTTASQTINALAEAAEAADMAAHCVGTTQAVLVKARATLAEVTAAQKNMAAAAAAVAQREIDGAQQDPVADALHIPEDVLQAAHAALAVKAGATAIKCEADRAEKAERMAVAALPAGVTAPQLPTTKEQNVARLTTPRLWRVRMIMSPGRYARVVRPNSGKRFYGPFATNGVSISLYFETDAERCKRVKSGEKPAFDANGRICRVATEVIADQGEGSAGPSAA
ncbi:hypothetical protein H4R19_001546 [Coemansia spiralis]|nr:hypothetical protein H4R19_001546 [Coemansia spiralis]